MSIITPWFVQLRRNSQNLCHKLCASRQFPNAHKKTNLDFVLATKFLAKIAISLLREILKMKKNFICLAILVFAISICSAKNAKLSQNALNIDIDYNDQVFPGDAVFIRLKFENAKSRKKTLGVSATAEIAGEKKSVSACDFYSLVVKRTSAEFLAGLPISSWTESGDYQIKIKYNVSGEGENEITLPLEIKEKEFESGVINLTKEMSAISSDTSLEKVEQSKKLNAIINSVNSENVLNLKKFILPVTSKRRTTAFAERIIYKYPSGKESTTVHAGIDFGLPRPPSSGPQPHMEIVATADGKIVMAENRIATGWTIIIEHLPGLYSMYYHMSEIKVKVGQMTKQGESLGLSGATGFANGEHLHWEMRLNSMIVNPDFFLNDFAFTEN